MTNPFIQKKYKHSRQYGSRINPLTISISLLIATGAYILPFNISNDVYTNDVISTSGTLSTPVEVKPVSIESKIQQYFPIHYKEVIAIAHAESNMQESAKGYNCYYDNTNTIVYSTRVKGSHSQACKISHRQFAWSVDCNILQVNHKGQTCPDETLDEHLEQASKLSKIQGLGAWVTYNQGLHKKYLATNN